jgi:hypothetical protein
MQRSDLASELRRDRAGVTTANQERELRDIAARMGRQIVETYRDHGISGAKGRRNPSIRPDVPGEVAYA